MAYVQDSAGDAIDWLPRRLMSLWCEKYRPQVLNDVVLLDQTKEFLQQCIQLKEIPHLLFYGASGVGKTTVARIIIREIDAESVELNASDERGIDTIRDRVKRFLMVSSIKTWKVVFFDEADALTPQAQFVLRNLMEKYSASSRLIFSVNYVEKIIDPIRSRFQVVYFEEVPQVSQVKLLQRVLTSENVTYQDDDLLRLVDDCQGDMRRAINEAQKLSKTGKLLYKSVKDLIDVERLWKLTKDKKWLEIREMLSNGVDSTYVLRKIFEFVYEEISPEVAADVIGEGLHRDVFAIDKGLNVLCCLIELGKYVR